VETKPASKPFDWRDWITIGSIWYFPVMILIGLIDVVFNPGHAGRCGIGGLATAVVLLFPLLAVACLLTQRYLRKRGKSPADSARARVSRTSK